MKPEEAISAIKNNMPTKGTYTILTEGLELAIQALEKQVPKKPIKDGNKIRCPACNLLIAYNKNIEQYCWTCGQNIEGCV